MPRMSKMPRFCFGFEGSEKGSSLHINVLAILRILGGFKSSQKTWILVNSGKCTPPFQKGGFWNGRREGMPLSVTHKTVFCLKHYFECFKQSTAITEKGCKLHNNSNSLTNIVGRFWTCKTMFYCLGVLLHIWFRVVGWVVFAWCWHVCVCGCWCFLWFWWFCGSVVVYLVQLQMF